MSVDNQNQHVQDGDEFDFDTGTDAENELDDEDLENVAGGWSGNDDGGG